MAIVGKLVGKRRGSGVEGKHPGKVHGDEMEGEWKVIPATGDIHRGRSAAASAVFNHSIYIFGGDSDDGFVNDLTTLSASGEFKQLYPTGDIPTPRRDLKAWTFDNNIYFFGGVVKDLVGLRKGDFVRNLQHLFSLTSDLYQYNPLTNVFKRLSTTGEGPSPRSGFAVAQLGHRVFIHGGDVNEDGPASFFILDLKTLNWTKMENSGIQSGSCLHTLTQVSSPQFVLLGGDIEGKISNRVAMFDVDKSEWTEQESLSSEYDGSEGGVMCHQAFTIRDDKELSVICIGGYIDKESKRHPNHFVLFHFS